MASSIPAVKVAIRDLLLARPGLDGVHVGTGDLVTDTPKEAVILVSVTDWVQEPVGMPARNSGRDENYTVNGIVWIVKPGANETVIRAAEERAFAIVGEVEAAISDNPELKGLGLEPDVQVFTALFAGGEQGAGVHPDGRWCQVDIRIDVHARVSVV